MRLRMLFLMTVLIAGLLLAVFASARDGGEGGYSLAEFSVGNLSCGSCVANIRTALGSVDGVGEVEVSVTTGRAKVEFEPRKIKADKIAEQISGAGYPAEVNQIVSVDDYRNLREDESRLTARYVARIGERLISRNAFAEVLARREAAGEPPQGGLLKAVWQELLQRELLLAAAERNKVVVQDGEVDLQLERLRREKGFAAMLAGREDGEADFRRELKEDMIIQRNIEDHVLKGEKNPLRNRQMLNEWYRGLVSETPVTIFDPALKAQVEGGGQGCGGCC